MVRLRAAKSLIRRFGLYTFQFLHGAIKGLFTHFYKSMILQFQFLHGAIKGGDAGLDLTAVTISIPTWCD